MDFSLNLMSLLGLSLVVGILVDDAIVVVENIHRHFNLGWGKLEEITPYATDEVGNPTILATFTVIFALMPLAFVSGMMGPYMSPIPINASAAMLFSLAVAFVITPWLTRLLLSFSHKIRGGEAAHHEEAEHHGDGGHHKHPADDFNGHVPNSVTSLLAAYRGFDTMFETTVIFTAGMALILLLRRPREEENTPQEGAVLRGQVILRVMTKIFIPFILVFGFYVITHGEIGPGGGFQGGVILATAFILYALIYGRNALYRIIAPKTLDVLAAVGVLLYAGVGVACLALGGKFLDYAVLDKLSPGDGEALGMTLVEYGVGITVCTVMIIIFNQLAEQAEAKAS